MSFRPASRVECENLKMLGMCSYGDRCHFSHCLKGGTEAINHGGFRLRDPREYPPVSPRGRGRGRSQQSRGRGRGRGRGGPPGGGWENKERRGDNPHFRPREFGSPGNGPIHFQRGGGIGGGRRKAPPFGNFDFQRSRTHPKSFLNRAFCTDSSSSSSNHSSSSVKILSATSSREKRYHPKNHHYPPPRPPRPPRPYRRSHSRLVDLPIIREKSSTGHLIQRAYRRPMVFNKLVDFHKPCIVFDIDGTLLNIDKRISNAMNPETGSICWDKALDGKHFHLDSPIDVARDYVNFLKNERRANIIYLSGRRDSTLDATMESLFRVHGFPKGYVIHRPIGMDSRVFKFKHLEYLQNVMGLRIDAYFGDRLLDDLVYCLKANVRPILVLANEWFDDSLRRQGLKGIVNHLLVEDTDENPPVFVERSKSESKEMKKAVNNTDDSDESLSPPPSTSTTVSSIPSKPRRKYSLGLIEYIRQSPWFESSYADIVPEQFTTNSYGESSAESNSDSS